MGENLKQRNIKCSAQSILSMALKISTVCYQVDISDIVREHRPNNTLTFQTEEEECLAAPDVCAAVGQHGTRQCP